MCTPTNPGILMVYMDKFKLLSASWVIRAKWRAREIPRFVRKFETIRDVQFWVFDFAKQRICAQSCGRIHLERMATVTIILLGRVSAVHLL